MDEWTAVILAGGIGSRLSPITSNIPKPLVPVVGKPMIVYAIDLLRYAGVSNIVIVVRHMGNLIRDFLAKRDFGIRIQIPDVDSLDTADALRKVSDLINTDHIIVSMADIITNINMREFLDFQLNKGGIGAISLVHTDDPKQFGIIVLDHGGKIQSFLEKPQSVELYLSSLISTQNVHMHRNVINTGIYAFHRDILELLSDTNLMDFGKDVFPYLLENNYALYGYIERYYWQDAGNPLFYKFTNWDLLRKWAWPIVPPGEEVKQDTWIGKNCSIPDIQNIHQFVAIGDDTHLSNNVTIGTLTSLGKSVTVGQNTRIKESVIWDHVKIGDNCQIVSSIICDSVQIGDNVIIKPDVVIASGSTVRSGTKIAAGKQFPPNSEIG